MLCQRLGFILGVLLCCSLCMGQMPIPAKMRILDMHVYHPEEHISVLSGEGEGYALDVTSEGISVKADGPAGLYYARQLIGQLQQPDGSLLQCHVQDQPRYAWRGLMLDVSRHYMTPDSICRIIELMGRYRLNRLHLHLTDAAGWRLQVDGYPHLTRIGAWRTAPVWQTWWNDGKRRYAIEGNEDAYGGYYTRDEIVRMVNYAAQHFVTIVPEIEFPAHSEEVFAAYPELCCTGQPYTCADFCLGNEQTYLFMTHVLSQVAELFPSNYIHVGGDEAGGLHWESCSRCQALMNREGIHSKAQLQAYAMRRIQHIADSLGKTIIGWDEVLQQERFSRVNPPVVMVWRKDDLAIQCREAGLPYILSPGQFCYLDKYQDAPASQPRAIGGYLPLGDVYSYRPDDEALGIQANLWTEYIPTASHAEYMLLPRLLALAEIAWSPESKLDWVCFNERLPQEMNWLRSHGYHPFDIEQEIGQLPSSLPKRYLSKGRKVHYNQPFHVAYPASGESSLTDGQSGGWSNTDGRWQGFLAPRGIDVTIDLGRVYRLHRLSQRFLQSLGAEIYLPAQLRVLVSQDGTNYHTVDDVAVQPCDEDTVYPTVCVSLSGRGRYIRVQASPSPLGGWLFTDEIVIE